MKNTVRIAGAVLLTIVSSASQAETVVEAMQECRNESNDLKRLICFDNVAESMNIFAGADQSVDDVANARPAQAPVVAATSAPASSNTQAASAPQQGPTFGMEMNTESLQKSMSATVTEVSSSPRGDFIITLDNGMVWRQNGESANYKMKVGDGITIERGFMNAFYLTKEGRSGRVNVRRIK
ncbi:hypothetical protein [Alteromonas confluentis]|uniref:Uncharacterized protein n=1 Tax=Alteromonas confluentis TaxID=1656094 RepID=A0A1E7Z8N9_9ALTE|nr:hypothetical protein [Alteromonas confluentis]OFC69764.1 hypothetical protein BFC18_17020 [Alteromonas confluentis]